ncbi:coiled-coil domain-containing protein 122 [Callorhinchus milii]|uniref:Dehydrogenase/reductase SDR family member 12 n=4 Tax=Callorhinchus milii TaxID=7868 RepID=K4FUK9_CALMI|nr:dehydrogenase/reductase SDR family member 12 [Callorhinchus milii]AFK11660.1 dehydrogenase/reductase SDR family member 12 [Callorhinchus milii]
MITGGNSGIGKATALEIAKRGGTVHLVCRNKERAEAAKEEIVKESNKEEIFVHILDMSRPKMILEFADKFQQENNKLDVLINNAGCMINQRELTADGLESNFATNTLGTYILTTALMPLLKKNEAARVITVSSGGMLVQKLNISDLQFKTGQFDGTMAYAQNKRQQVIMTEQWAKMHKEIHFSSMHPGWADTPAVRTSMPDFYEKMKNRLRTEGQGADTVVWLAISNVQSQHPSGLFFQGMAEQKVQLSLSEIVKEVAEQQDRQTVEAQDNNNLLRYLQAQLSKQEKEKQVVLKELRTIEKQIYQAEDESENEGQLCTDLESQIWSLIASNSKLKFIIQEEEEKYVKLLSGYDKYRKKILAHKEFIGQLESKNPIMMQLEEKMLMMQKLKAKKKELVADLQNPEGNIIKQVQGEITDLKAKLSEIKEAINEKSVLLIKEQERHAQLRKEIEVQNKRCEAILKRLYCQLNKVQSNKRHWTWDMQQMEKTAAHLRRCLGNAV